MQRFLSYVFLGGFLFLVTGCDFFQKKTIAVEYKNFEEEVSIRQNLTFRFSQDMVTAAMLNTWLDNQYMVFQPEVKGKFKWTSTKELTFSPEQGFKPSTNYTATFAEDITAQSEKPLALNDEDKAFQFHTPYLSLLSTDVFWAMGAQGNPEIRMNLSFNYPVNPEDVGRLASLNIGGQAAQYQITTAQASSSIQLAVQQSPQAKYDNQAIDLQLAKGLSLPESEYATPEDLTFESVVPNKDQFRIVQAIAEYEGEDGFVHVYTNQAVGVEDIKRYIKIQPNVDFRVEKLDYGFLLKGDFAIGTNYNLLIDDKLRGIFQGKLAKSFQQYVIFGQLDPSISFAHKKAIYLTRNGNKNVGVRIVSIPEVKITIYKIYKNNVLAFLRDNGKLNDYYDDYYYDYTDYSKYGDPMVEKTVSTNDLEKSGGLALVNLDITEENDFKGIYVVKVQSSEQRYVNSSQVVAFSDIGLIVKENADEVMVFANSITTAEPMGSVEVKLVSSNNQEVYTVMTNTEGIARFSDLKNQAPGFRVQMVTANKGEDFNYLHFQQTEVETSRYEVGGIRYNDAGLQAFLYGARDLYRPGETVYLRTIIRDKNWAPVAKQPIKMRLLMPNGKPLMNQQGELSEEGSFETSVTLPSSAVTGSYIAEVYTSNDVLLSSKAISVEEFMPDRIKVTPSVDKEEAKPGESFTVSGEALNLFGPPAADRKYEMQLSLSKKYFSPKGLEEYNFMLEGGGDNYFDTDFREGRTDAQGQFSAEFNIPSKYKFNGILEARVFTTVFDETGRPVSRLSTVEVPTQDAMYGIAYFDRYVKARESLNIPLIAVNSKGQVFNQKQAKIQIIRYEWQSVLEKDYNGRYRYVSQKKQQVLVDRNLSINGKGTTFPFIPAQSGEYEIRVKDEAASNYVSQYFYAYSWGATSNSSFEVDKEGRVAIEVDKDTYEAGETANVLFKTPFPGKMLVTVEREKVLDYFIVDTDKKSASLSIPMKEEYLPNAYISATLIKPLTDNAIPLTVAHGYEPIFVEDANTKLNLEIDAPEKSRSRTSHEITVKADAGSEVEVTIAVVDEGILQIKNYQSPDPHAFFFQKRALMVNAYDLYPRLFPELKPSANSFGADMAMMGKRANPVANKRVKLVSYWSGTLKTNSSGEVKYSFDIPEFSGDLRIMAVASQGKKFGSASTNMKVADPIVISSGVPRFLSPGDVVKVNTTLTNTTDRTASVAVSLTTEGAVKPDGSKSQSIDVPANSEKRVSFDLRAEQTIGQGKIKIEAEGLGETFLNTTEITVRPSTSLLKSSGAGAIKGGQSTSIDMARGYIPSSIDGKLWVSKSPMVQFADHLQYLVRYPHGCIEQTVSAAFPQIYYAEVSKSLGQGDHYEPAKNVEAAIRKLYTMQSYDGSMFYWQGGSYTSWWGTVYAAHFLQEAQKAGFEVDQNVLSKMYSYLRSQLKSKQRRQYAYINAANQRQEKTIAPREIFYSLYVLANADKKEVSRMNYYKKRTEMMTMDSRYLLACTYLLIGDNGSYRKLLPNGFTGERSVNEFGGSFGSFIRDQALALNILLEVDPSSGQIGTMTKQLTEQMKLRRYLNTQERAFAMLALGKIAKKANQSNVSAKIVAGGNELSSFSGDPVTLTDEVAGKQINIETNGEGELYYFWELEGLNATGEYVEEDSYLKVRREFFDRNGSPINTNTFAQNELIVVKVTLNTLNNIPKVENVVITDMLPAGFEVENPRIGGIPNASWIKDQGYPEHTDFRDDRVHFFTTVTSKPRSYFYMVRAVTPGTYKMGPVSADAMYNGEYHSYHGGGEIVVE